MSRQRRPDPAKPTRIAATSGVLRCDGTQITYSSGHYGSFSIPISEVAVIGEFTTEEGPMIDDWFLVFVPRTSGGEWFEASIYAEGTDAVRETLSSTLGYSLDVGLVASTDFESRILWPAALAGRPLFRFENVTGSGLTERIKRIIFPKVVRTLSPEAISTRHS